MKQTCNGIMVVNGFIKSDKFNELYARLETAAKSVGLALQMRTNADLMCCASDGLPLSEKAKADIDNADFVLFWDKDIRLAYQLEALGLRLFNCARAIENCDDKSLTHIVLSNKVPMPKTIIAPMTFPNIGYNDTPFLKVVEDAIGYPMVVKECFGSFGMQVYLAHDRNELLFMLDKTKGKQIIFQEFVRESFARDVRVYVVGGKAEAAMLRQNNTGDFRANVALGSETAEYALSEDEAEIAIRAAQILNLDFAGVDLLFGKDDTPLLCEVNSNAHFIGIGSCTGVDIAKKIMLHIKKEMY